MFKNEKKLIGKIKSDVKELEHFEIKGKHSKKHKAQGTVHTGRF